MAIYQGIYLLLKKLLSADDDIQEESFYPAFTKKWLLGLLTILIMTPGKAFAVLSEEGFYPVYAEKDEKGIARLVIDFRAGED